MPMYSGMALIEANYTVKADDAEQAKDFIAEMVVEEFGTVDGLMIKDIIQIG